MQKLSLAAKAGVATGVLASLYWRLKIRDRILGLKLKFLIDLLDHENTFRIRIKISNEKNIIKITKIR